MQRGSIGGKLLGALAAVVGLVVLVVVAVVILLQSGGVSRRVREEVVPRVSAALGRDVGVQDVKLRLFPSIRVELTGTSVAGRAGEPPLVQLDALEIQLALWPLVRSLGRDVEVEGFRLVKPVVNLVRAADGTWNYEGLGGAGKPPPSSQPPDTKAPSAGGSPPAAARKVVVAHASIEDGAVRYIDRAAGQGEAAVAVSRIGLTADHVGVGEPLQAKLSAALAGPEKNFEASLSMDRLPGGVAELGPGRYPQVTGDLALTGLDLDRVRAFLPPSVTGAMTGGRVEAQAKLATRGDAYHVDGSGKLSQVRLRGEPAQGGFELHAVANAATGAVHATIDKLSLKGPGVDLGGNLTYDGKPTKIRFAIAGPLLDLGQLMAALPAQHEQKPSTGPLLTAAQRRQVEALDVAGTLDIAKVVRGAFTATGFKARAVLQQGVFVLQDAHAGFFGGKVDASGTRLDLAKAVPSWSLAAKLDAVDVGQAMSAMAGSAPLLGKLDGSVDLDGAGVDWPTLRKALTGKGALALANGELTTTDVGGQVLGAVAAGLRAAGQQGAATSVGGATGKTSFRDLAAQFTVKDGAMSLSRPLSFTAPFGATSLGGRIGLDGQLGLEGTVKVPKQALAGVAGRLPLPATLDVPLGIGGSLEHPSVQVDAKQAVGGLVSGAVKQGAQELGKGLQDKAKGAAQRGLGDLLHGLGK